MVHQPTRGTRKRTARWGHSPFRSTMYEVDATKLNFLPQKELVVKTLLLFYLFLISSDLTTSVTLTRIVQTRFGKLQGFVRPVGSSRYLKPVEVFLGVPYATPPVGPNRFSPTRTVAPWSGVKLADRVSPVCPQKLPDISNTTAALGRMPKGRLQYLRRILPFLQEQSEDCLYLNIFAPAKGNTTLYVISSLFIY